MKRYFAWAKDEEIRKRASSGGFVTACILGAIENMVDCAVIVKKISVYEGIPLLTSDREEIKNSAGSLHGVAINLAGFIRKGMKVVLPAKPCDAMGIIERAKREQVNLDDVYMIGLNCAGQLHPARMREMVEKVYRIPPESVRKEEIEKGKLIIYGDKEYARKIAELEELGYGRRESCRYCNILIPKMADLACGNWGAPPGKTFVEVLTEKGKEIFENAMERGYVDYEDATEEGIKEREKIYERMLKLSSRWREKLDFFAGLPDEKRLERYVKILERCISCGSCMEVCPICDCMERAKCLSEDEPYRVPFYILARIFHLMDSCIGCGQCEDVCPAEIPLTLIHQRFGRRIQKRYNYLPGMEVGRPPIFVSE